MRLFKGQLTLLEQGEGGDGKQGHWVIAAWHWNWSITWSWLLWYWPSNAYSTPTKWGTWSFARQKTMRRTVHEGGKRG